MTNNQETDEKIQQLKETIEDWKASTEKQSRINGDDQVFVAVVFTFITIFLSFQYTDVANLFTLANSPTATFSAIIFTIASLSSLGIAVYLRYWATLVDDSKKNYLILRGYRLKYTSSELRYGSLEALVVGFEFMFVIIVVNFIAFFQNFYFESFMFLIAILSILFFERIENKVLSVYKVRDFIPKDAEPLAQVIFSAIAVLLCGGIFALLLTVSLTYLQFGYSSFTLMNSTTFVVSINSLTVFWGLLIFYLYWRFLGKIVVIIRKEKANREMKKQMQSYEAFIEPLC